MAEEDQFDEFDERMFDSQVLDVQDQIAYKPGSALEQPKGGAGEAKPAKIPKKF